MLVTRTGLCLGLVLIFVDSIVCKSVLDNLDGSSESEEESGSNSNENVSIEDLLDDSNSLEESHDTADYPDEGFEDYSTPETIELHPHSVSIASSSSSSSEEILIPMIPQQTPQKIIMKPKPEQIKIVPVKIPEVKVPKAQGRGFGRSFLAKVFKIGGDNETSNSKTDESGPTPVMPKGRRIFSAGSESTTEKDVTTTTTTEEVTTTLKLETSTTEPTETTTFATTSTTEITTEEILETTAEATEVATSAEKMDIEFTTSEAEATSESTAKISNEITNNIESTAIEVSWPDLEIERNDSPTIGKERNWPEENEDSGLNEEEITALEIIKRSISKLFQN